MDSRVCAFCAGEISGGRAGAKYCSVECNNASLAARRKAEKWAGVSTDRSCEACGGSMDGKRPHARFCSRPCKSIAGDRRRRGSMTCGERYAFDHARYLKESERRKAYQREYHQRNKELTRAIRLKRRGRLKVSGANLTDKDWRDLVLRYRNCCAYCGVGGVDLQRDHVIPLSRGGSNAVGNIAPACARCNYAKGVRLASDFRHRVLPNIVV